MHQGTPLAQCSHKSDKNIPKSEGTDWNFLTFLTPTLVIVVPCAITAAAAAIKLVGVSQLNPCTDFHQIFRVYLPQEDLELIRFWGVSATTVAMATLLQFLNHKVYAYSKT